MARLEEFALAEFSNTAHALRLCVRLSLHLQVAFLFSLAVLFGWGGQGLLVESVRSDLGHSGRVWSLILRSCPYRAVLLLPAICEDKASC